MGLCTFGCIANTFCSCDPIRKWTISCRKSKWSWTMKRIFEHSQISLGFLQSFPLPGHCGINRFIDFVSAGNWPIHCRWIEHTWTGQSTVYEFHVDETWLDRGTSDHRESLEHSVHRYILQFGSVSSVHGKSHTICQSEFSIIIDFHLNLVCVFDHCVDGSGAVGYVHSGIQNRCGARSNRWRSIAFILSKRLSIWWTHIANYSG